MVGRAGGAALLATGWPGPTEEGHWGAAGDHNLTWRRVFKPAAGKEAQRRAIKVWEGDRSFLHADPWWPESQPGGPFRWAAAATNDNHPGSAKRSEACNSVSEPLSRLLRLAGRASAYIRQR